MYVKENRPRESLASSFVELSNLALESIKAMGRVTIVCGPITTGGRGSAEANMRALALTIRHLKYLGIPVFDQCPFEPTLWSLKDQWEKAGNQGYCTPILTDFYLPLYKSGHIYRAYFLPGWESSYGARWERRELAILQVQIIDLEEEQIKGILQKEP